MVWTEVCLIRTLAASSPGDINRQANTIRDARSGAALNRRLQKSDAVLRLRHREWTVIRGLLSFQAGRLPATDQH